MANICRLTKIRFNIIEGFMHTKFMHWANLEAARLTFDLLQTINIEIVFFGRSLLIFYLLINGSIGHEGQQ